MRTRVEHRFCANKRTHTPTWLYWDTAHMRTGVSNSDHVWLSQGVILPLSQDVWNCLESLKFFLFSLKLFKEITCLKCCGLCRLRHDTAELIIVLQGGINMLLWLTWLKPLKMWSSSLRNSDVLTYSKLDTWKPNAAMPFLCGQKGQKSTKHEFCFHTFNSKTHSLNSY